MITETIKFKDFVANHENELRVKNYIETYAKTIHKTLRLKYSCSINYKYIRFDGGLCVLLTENNTRFFFRESETVGYDRFAVVNTIANSVCGHDYKITSENMVKLLGNKIVEAMQEAVVEIDGAGRK